MSEHKTTYEAFRESSDRARRLLRQEELILDVTERLVLELKEVGVTQTQLAGRLGKSKAFVSQLLAGNRNLTLRTLSDVCDALELVVRLEVLPERAERPKDVFPNRCEWLQNIQWDREQHPWMTELRVVGKTTAGPGREGAELAGVA